MENNIRAKADCICASEIMRITKEARDAENAERRRKSDDKLEEIYASILTRAKAGKTCLTVPAANKYDWDYIFEKLRTPDDQGNCFSAEKSYEGTHAVITWG